MRCFHRLVPGFQRLAGQVIQQYVSVMVRLPGELVYKTKYHQVMQCVERTLLWLWNNHSFVLHMKNEKISIIIYAFVFNDFRRYSRQNVVGPALTSRIPLLYFLFLRKDVTEVSIVHKTTISCFRFSGSS